MGDGDVRGLPHNNVLAGISAGALPVKLNPFVLVAVLATCRLLAGQHVTPISTPLAALLIEAEANNSQVAAADDASKASSHVAQQATALPGLQLSIDSFNVGSPKPFAGFSNSEFAYVSLGVLQEIPYPGKLKLKGEVAKREMRTQTANAVVVRSSVAEQVKLLYLEISYSTAAISYLKRTDSLLQSLIQDALSKYGIGRGSQSAIIKAQIERTKILRQDTMHNKNLWQAQARLKQLLHRPQESSDIYPDPLVATPFIFDQEELQKQLRSSNPKLLVDAASVEKQTAQLESARLDMKPDFTFGYAFQLTGEGYRDRHLISASMRLPNHSQVDGEISQAIERANRAQHEMDSDAQQKLAELQEQYVALTSSEELLNEFQEGLIPQAEAIFRSEQSAYQSDKQELEPVLSALLDILALESDYQQALLDHETALVRIETLTGRKIR